MLKYLAKTSRKLGLSVCLVGVVLGTACVADNLAPVPESTSGSVPANEQQRPDARVPAFAEASQQDASAGASEVDAPSPTLESMSPNSAVVGASTLDIEVRGTGFVERTTLQIGGLTVPTQVLSSTRLRANIASKWLQDSQQLFLSVGTSPPGGGASAERPLSVVYPKPSVVSLSPLGVGVGASTTVVTLNGNDFTSRTGLRAGDLELVVKSWTATSLTALLPQSLLQKSGLLSLVAWNPSPGGGATEPLTFVVSNPNVVISELSPAVIRVGDPATTLSVMGSGFVSTSLVSANGIALATTVVSPNELRARFTSSMMASNFAITASSPPPGGGLSAPVQLSVINPVPVLVASSLSSLGTEFTDTQIELTGSGFVSTSRATVGGEAVTCTFVDAQHLSMLVPARMMSKAGFLAVQVQNLAPGGGYSSTLDILVANPTPTILGSSVSSIPRGTTRTTVTLSTRNVVQGAVVYLGSAAMTTRVGLNGAVSTDLVWPDHEIVPLTIRNPEPCRGASQPFSITVNCDPRGAELLFPVVDEAQTVPSNLISQSRFASFDATEVDKCATVTGATVPVIGRGSSQPVRSVVVQNTTFAPVALEAWAVCGTPEGAAFLSLYPGRKAMPTSYDDRRMCTGVIARGGLYSSPDAIAGATQCPGLTAANTGAVALGVCETAVVVMQAINVSIPSSLPGEVRVRVRATGAAANEKK